MENTQISLKEAYKTLFELEDKIEFLHYFINEQLKDEDALTQEDINRINKNIIELEELTYRRNNLHKKLQSFDSIYIDIEA